MKFSESTLRRVLEAEYLTRENTQRYRGIIRVMYKAYEKMKYSLYRRDILENLLQYEQFSDYTDELLKKDLEVLVGCGNIFDRADASHANTPEEYINKVFLYQLSPITIEIERMLIRLENVTTGALQKSSLESSYIEDFKAVLLRVDELSEKDIKAHNDWFAALDESFKKFSENYKDYIGDFYSPRINELMQASEFIIFKERFIVYLRNFISGIQMNATIIGNLIDNLDIIQMHVIISKAADYKNSIPQMNSVFNKDEFIELSIGKYETMREWFLWLNGRPPLYEQLIRHTNEIIRKITRFALQILDKRNMSINRKKDYLKLLEIFSKCEDVNCANKVAALAFGVSGTTHIIAERYRSTDSMHTNSYEEPPRMVSIKPHVTNYKEKITKTNIPDYSAEKEARRQEILELQKFNEEQIRVLISENKIDLKTLPEIDSAQRMTILSWFSKKIKDTDNTYLGETDFGAKFTIRKLDDNEEIKIHCEDGDFYMPHFVIEFEQSMEVE